MPIGRPLPGWPGHLVVSLQSHGRPPASQSRELRFRLLIQSELMEPALDGLDIYRHAARPVAIRLTIS